MAKLVRRGPPTEIRRSTRCCIIIFRVAGELGHPGHGAGTFRCGADCAKVICMENSISVNKNSSGLKDDLMFKKRN